MRNIKFVLIILALIILALSSCLKLIYYEVVIENNTEHDIKIEGFYNEGEIEAISIKPYDSYVYPQYSAPKDSYRLFQECIDSVYITFDNEKVIEQCCTYDDYDSGTCTTEKDIIPSGDYEREDLGYKELRYTYTITEEDYERAVFIDSLENR